MNPERDSEGLLGPYRVLDLTDEKGFLAGKLMGDLGADVIKVEPAGGHPARNIGPFYKDTPHPEKSLYWYAFNLNKRGITLNLKTEDGKGIFKKLVKTADFVIESFEPGFMNSLGLGYEALSQVNPGIIVTAVTPFGQDGPYSRYKTTDLINFAMGGHMYLNGDDDRPPVRITFPVTYCHAGAEAAAASTMALYHRNLTGEGQFIDVSIQECIVWTLMNTTVTWDLNRRNVTRGGALRRNPATGTVSRSVWPCKDGYVTFGLMGGGGAGQRTGNIRAIQALVAWIASEGMASETLQNKDWGTFDARMVGQEDYDALAKEFLTFFKTKTVNELYDRAVKDRMMIAPVCSAKDIIESPQLAARGYWVEMEHPELGTTIIYPSAFVKLWGGVPEPKIQRRAPLIGEHNGEIYEGELGLSKGELAVLKERGVI